jgi:hypothetical protein
MDNWWDSWNLLKSLAEILLLLQPNAGAINSLERCRERVLEYGKCKEFCIGMQRSSIWSTLNYKSAPSHPDGWSLKKVCWPRITIHFIFFTVYAHMSMVLMPIIPGSSCTTSSIRCPSTTESKLIFRHRTCLPGTVQPSQNHDDVIFKSTIWKVF